MGISSNAFALVLVGGHAMGISSFIRSFRSMPCTYVLKFSL